MVCGSRCILLDPVVDLSVRLRPSVSLAQQTFVAVNLATVLGYELFQLEVLLFVLGVNFLEKGVLRTQVPL